MTSSSSPHRDPSRLSLPSTVTLRSTITQGESGYRKLTCNATTPLRTVRYNTESMGYNTKNNHYPTWPQKDINGYIYQISPLSPGWQEHTHPDGKPYFRHQEWKAVTEANLRDEKTLKALEVLHFQIQEEWVNHPAHELLSNFELYLTVTLSPTTGRQEGSYYFADHSSERIFWLEDTHLQKVTDSDEEVPPSTNYDLLARQNYYSHLENFPCHNILPEGSYEHLRHMLTYICTDHITSGYSATSAWSSEEAKSLLDLLQGLPNNDQQPEANQNAYRLNANRSYRTWFVSRLMVVILNSQIMHNHGLINARTDRLESVKPTKATLLGRLLGIFTFFGHLTYAQRFRNSWADDVASSKGWNGLLASLLVDWSDANLLSTVILSANMAFLALQNLPSSSPAVATSIVSTFTSIGSIVIGLHHVWRFRDKSESSVEEVATYFKRASIFTGDLQLLAFFLSLPLSLLAWSIVFFATSLSIYAFGVVRFYISSLALAVVTLCVVSTVLFFWGLVFRN